MAKTDPERIYKLAKKYGKEEFKRMIESATNQNDLADKLGVSSYILRKAAKELGIVRPQGRPISKHLKIFED